MYNQRDLYPNWGAQSTQESTIPDPSEQEAIANVSAETVPSPTKPNQGKQMLMVLGGIVLLMVVFGK